MLDLGNATVTSVQTLCTHASYMYAFFLTHMSIMKCGFPLSPYLFVLDTAVCMRKGVWVVSWQYHTCQSELEGCMRRGLKTMRH